MSDVLKNLTEARLRAVQEAREIAERAAREGATPETDEAYQRASAQIDRYDTMIAAERQRIEREAEFERAMASAQAAHGTRREPDRSALDRETALWNELKAVLEGERRGVEFGLPDMYHTLALSGRFGVEAKQRAETFFNIGHSAQAANGEGKELNPGTFVRELYRALVDENPILSAGVRIITTERGETLTLPKKLRSPKATDPAGNRSTVVSREGGTIARTKGSITTATLTAIKYAQIVAASKEFTEWSVFDGQALMAEDLGEVLGAVTAYDLTMGTRNANPAGSPGGIVTQATLTSPWTLGTPTHEDVLGLIYGVGEKYARRGRFMMNRQTLRTVRLIKDGNGAYIYNAATDPAQPDTILGYPVVTNPDMPVAQSAGDRVVLFGDFSKYYVRVVGSMRVEWSNDVYFENDLVGVKGVMYLDGDLFDVGAVVAGVATAAPGGAD